MPRGHGRRDVAEWLLKYRRQLARDRGLIDLSCTVDDFTIGGNQVRIRPHLLQGLSTTPV